MNLAMPGMLLESLVAFTAILSCAAEVPRDGLSEVMFHEKLGEICDLEFIDDDEVLSVTSDGSIRRWKLAKLSYEWQGTIGDRVSYIRSAKGRALFQTGHRSIVSLDISTRKVSTVCDLPQN